MGIFGKDNKTSINAGGDVSIEIKQYKAEADFRLYVVKELHGYINELLPKLSGNGVSKYKNQMNELAAKFTSSENPKKLEHVFEKYRKIINTHISQSLKQLEEKEKEFKEIIKMLTDGISTMSYDNREFNSNITEHSSRLTELHILDDIKIIKEGLKSEIGKVSEIVKKKVENDTNQLRMLSQKVTVLNDDLKKAEKASMTDKLSGAFNRFAFDNHINNLVEKMAMRWSSFAVVMIDIDNFKSINDTYGHLVGDRVIVAAVQKCKTVLRKNDFIARYGGEEFVIILDGAPLKVALRKANEICKAVSSTDFLINKEKHQTLSFTISLGVSTFQTNDTASSVVDRADKALYKAKQTGKNRAVTEKELD